MGDAFAPRHKVVGCAPPMTPEAPEIPPAEQTMHLTRRIVLALLAVCAVLIVVHGFAGEEPPPDREVATLGVLLALGSIVLRRVGGSPVIKPRTAFLLGMIGLLACGVLGLLGVYLAYSFDSPESGILFTLAGVIFALRPSQPISASRA
jgi:hypothetical protein